MIVHCDIDKLVSVNKKKKSEERKINIMSYNAKYLVGFVKES